MRGRLVLSLSPYATLRPKPVACNPPPRYPFTTTSSHIQQRQRCTTHHSIPPALGRPLSRTTTRSLAAISNWATTTCSTNMSTIPPNTIASLRNKSRPHTSAPLRPPRVSHPGRLKLGVQHMTRSKRRMTFQRSILSSFKQRRRCLPAWQHSGRLRAQRTTKTRTGRSPCRRTTSWALKKASTRPLGSASPIRCSITSLRCWRRWSSSPYGGTRPGRGTMSSTPQSSPSVSWRSTRSRIARAGCSRKTILKSSQTCCSMEYSGIYGA
ncbi:hypothetical protein C8Q72DRAFT_38090 [Fomitopsis betulina]|nr:hypothetical protein C8Q72DRAFT_38090 [Fomitopsis betulina]